MRSDRGDHSQSGRAGLPARHRIGPHDPEGVGPGGDQPTGTNRECGRLTGRIELPSTTIVARYDGHGLPDPRQRDRPPDPVAAAAHLRAVMGPSPSVTAESRNGPLITRSAGRQPRASGRVNCSAHSRVRDVPEPLEPVRTASGRLPPDTYAARSPAHRSLPPIAPILGPVVSWLHPDRVRRRSKWKYNADVRRLGSNRVSLTTWCRPDRHSPRSNRRSPACVTSQEQTTGRKIGSLGFAEVSRHFASAVSMVAQVASPVGRRVTRFDRRKAADVTEWIARSSRHGSERATPGRGNVATGSFEPGVRIGPALEEQTLGSPSRREPRLFRSRDASDVRTYLPLPTCRPRSTRRVTAIRTAPNSATTTIIGKIRPQRPSLSPRGAVHQAAANGPANVATAMPAALPRRPRQRIPPSRSRPARTRPLVVARPPYHQKRPLREAQHEATHARNQARLTIARSPPRRIRAVESSPLNHSGGTRP